LHEVIFGFGDDGALREHARSDSARRFDCSELRRTH
jgi:hypothetical protein